MWILVETSSYSVERPPGVRSESHQRWLGIEREDETVFDPGRNDYQGFGKLYQKDRSRGSWKDPVPLERTGLQSDNQGEIKI